MDKPADYGSAFRGSNPLGGTYSLQKQSYGLLLVFLQ